MYKLSSALLRSLWALIASASFVATSFGQSYSYQQDRGAFVPLPSTYDYSGGQGSGLALGVSGDFAPIYSGSDEYEGFIAPYIVLQYTFDKVQLFLEYDRLGLRSKVIENWLTNGNGLGLGTELIGFCSFGTRDLMSRQYGIEQPGALATGLPKTKFSGGVRSIGFIGIHRQAITEKIQLLLQGRVDFLSKEVKASPLVSEDIEGQALIALVYQF